MSYESWPAACLGEEGEDEQSEPQRRDGKGIAAGLGISEKAQWETTERRLALAEHNPLRPLSKDNPGRMYAGV